jgi:predicted nuclease of predicted toxin-antitoxin system
MFVIRGGSREAALPGSCMKLLIDQNLPRRLTVDLQSSFPGTSHVWRLGLAESSDEVVWDYAAEKGYAIVSKDTDFINLALLNGHPPKVIHLQIGNCSTETIRTLLLSSVPNIHDFLNDSVESLLILQH